jgi:uncharacterized protein
MPRTVSGVGIGLRRDFYDELLATERQVDWLEIVSENFVGMAGRPARVLAACAERWPLVPHGVALSVGGDRPNDRYVAELAPLVAALDPPFFSDHLCYSSIGGHELFDLLPLPWSDAAVEHVAGRARRAAEAVGRPLVLENITTYAVMPGGNMSEPEFITAVLERSGCGLLLDVNNLYLNARNSGQDPRALLAAMPLGNVRQIHLAGFTRDDDVLLDTHSRAVSDDVWSLYREALRRTGPVPTLIEWDQDIPSLDAVLDQADMARAIYQESAAEAQARAATSPPGAPDHQAPRAGREAPL